LQQFKYLSESLSNNLRQVGYSNAADVLRNEIITRLLKYQTHRVPQRFIMRTILYSNLNYEEVITNELREIASKTQEEIESMIRRQDIAFLDNAPHQRGERGFDQSSDEFTRCLNSQTNLVSNI
jgi:hypothetical protein